MLKLLFRKLENFRSKATLILALLLALVVYSSAYANDTALMFEEASKNYTAGKYEEAYTIYKKIDSLGYKSENLYYNLANSAYKTNRVGEAIYYYEKAKLIYGAGSDEDTEINLELANLKTVDRIDAAPRSFFDVVLGGFLGFFNINTLAWLVILSVWVFFIFLILEIKRLLPIGKSARLITRTVFLTVMMFFLVTFILKNVEIAAEHNAVVLDKLVSVRSEPNDSAKSMFIIHEGLKISWHREQESWVEIRLPDGNKGWVEKKSLGFL